MSRRALEVVGMLTVAAVLVPGGLQAGEVQVGGQGGTGTPPGPPCGAGCDVQVDWNPHVDCDGVYPDLDALLNCMLNEQMRAASDFDSWLLNSPPYGIAVERFLPWGDPPDTVEIGRLKISENYLGIGTTQLTIARTGLVARIRGVTEAPHNDGRIIIQLDDDIVEQQFPPDTVTWSAEFDTTSTYLTALDLNVAISQWLRGCGFEVYYDAGYFVVVRVGGFKRVQFRSEDDGVKSSDIALLPKTDPEVQHLFPNGGGF